ncbi:hypothetical protein C7212DRAFT_351905 [Tuber magnatum]|uniref:Uncharacterized protein n=1 Tax=Tuber magnatum TaxID=42249 RepID=A0A317STW0_9PEZI|nr:hypothetical protein C7212DRAFT_351905 [Tuber magnatum]
MQTLQLLFILPFVQYTAPAPLPNKLIGRIRPHSHYRNHPRSTDQSPQFGDPPIYGSGPGDFCDPPTTITVTAPGPAAAVGGAQSEPVTSTVTVTAKGNVKPERAITVTMETRTVVLPGSTETVTMRATGSEATATGETSEVTVIVSAQNVGGVPSTITIYSTSIITVGDPVNAGESMPTLNAGATTPLAPASDISQCLYFNRRACSRPDPHRRDTHGIRLPYRGFNRRQQPQGVLKDK